MIVFFSKTASQTGSAVNERQKLTMTSTIVPETQTFSFAGWASQAKVDEKQTIDVVPTTTGYLSYFRLGMDGAYSGMQL